MSTGKRKKLQTANDFSFKDKLNGIMLAVVVGIMPLIVRVAVRATSPDLRFLSFGEEYADVFVFWKSVFIIAPAIVILLYNAFDWLTGGKMPNFKLYLKNVPVILSIVYLVFVLVSAIASSYSHTAWLGTKARDEGAVMWLVYFVVFTAAMFYVRRPKYAKPILWGLTFSSVIMGLIGVSQLVGRDFFSTAFAQNLITLGVDRVAAIDARFDIANGTLFNPNTFGKYTAMVAPVLLICGVVYDGKRAAKILMLFGGALMLVGVFASSSLGGLVGISAAVAVFVVTFLCNFVYGKIKNVNVNENVNNANLQKGKNSASEQDKLRVGRVAIMFGGLVAVVILALLFIPPLNNRVTTLFTRLGEAAAAETTTAERFVFDGEGVYVYRGGGRVFSMTVYTMDRFDNWMAVRDGAGQEILPAAQTPMTHEAPASYTFNIPGFTNIIVNRYSDAFTISPEGQINPFFLTFYEGKVYGLMLDFVTRVDLSQPVPAWGFEGRETWGSSRGYIWSRSFPLMPRRVIIGSGPDTFINVFPHYDMVGLQLAFDNPYQIVDKAHNLFIQTWVSTGGISAIALFALFAHYLFTTFVGLVKSKGETPLTYGLRLGLLAGISGFVMSSMATDSTIGSTGVFFVLLGMGYGLNMFLEKQRKPADNKAKKTAK
jgi:hypothetical protein